MGPQQYPPPEGRGPIDMPGILAVEDDPALRILVEHVL
jgi:hypothetical protein